MAFKSFRISDEKHRQLKIILAITGIKFKSIVMPVIDEFIKKHKDLLK